MAHKKRYISTAFWRDSYTASLTKDEKLLFLYLLTNPDANLSGIYQLPISHIKADTGFNDEELSRMFDKFNTEKKILYCDGWVILVNSIKHQNIQNINIRSGIKRELDCLPTKIREINQVKWVLYVSRSLMDVTSHLDLDFTLTLLNLDLDLDFDSNKAILQIQKMKPEEIIYKCKYFAISKDKYENHKSAYPAVDTMFHYKKMNSWLDDNPTRRPKSDVPKFVNGWLSREQTKESIRASRGDGQPLPFRNRNVAVEQMIELEKEGITFDDIYPEEGGKYDTQRIHGKPRAVLSGTADGRKRLPRPDDKKPAD